jgi:hypothetical protein
MSSAFLLLAGTTHSCDFSTLSHKYKTPALFRPGLGENSMNNKKGAPNKPGHGFMELA